MTSQQAQLHRLLTARPQESEPSARGSKPCPCCGQASVRFYRVQPAAYSPWSMACVLCAVRAIENSAEAVLGGSASAAAVAASSVRKRRRRDRRAA